MATTYTLKDFEYIKQQHNFTSSYDENIYELINLLSSKVCPIQSKSNPQSSNTNKRNRRKMQEENWEESRKFEGTQMKQREGIEKITSLIRVEINKISETTYDKQLIIIKEILSNLFDTEQNEVVNTIVDTFTDNDFYVDLYVSMTSELNKRFDWFYELFIEKLKLKRQSLLEIIYVDSDDYDNFCENNKRNDNRIYVSKYYVSLFKKNLINQENIDNIIKEYIVSFDKNLNVNSFVNEQISINLCLYVESLTTISDDIISFINTVIQYNVSSYEGISNKIKFKFMDLLDNIKNKEKK